MRKDYDKAVRDRIPEIIEGSGRTCSVRRVTDDEFICYLERKLTEELQEYLDSRDIEELADIIEVIIRITELRGMTMEELEVIRKRKARERGPFSENVILQYTE